jgi:hypothetical protein
VEVTSAYIPHTSQNFRADSVIERHFIPFAISSQLKLTMDLTMEGTSDDRSTGLRDYDKLITLKERLRAVEGNNPTDHVLAIEVCLVPNIMVPKEFKVPSFISTPG